MAEFHIYPSPSSGVPSGFMLSCSVVVIDKKTFLKPREEKSEAAARMPEDNSHQPLLIPLQYLN